MLDKLPPSVRLVIACGLSVLIITLWQIYFVEPMVEEQKAEQKAAQMHQVEPNTDHSKMEIDHFLSHEEAIEKDFKSAGRIKFANDKISGSINLRGARIDDLTLSKYKESLGHDKKVVLLHPSSTEEVYFAEFGWVKTSTNKDIELPDHNTIWKSNKQAIHTGEAAELSWINNSGIKFIINVSLDQNYMFNVEQVVENNSANPIKLGFFATLSRVNVDPEASVAIIHEGAIGVADNKLHEISFKDLAKEPQTLTNLEWVGFSDKYWLTSLAMDKKLNPHAKFLHFTHKKIDRFQGSVTSDAVVIEPQQSFAVKTKLFAGAKELDVLDQYEKQYNIPLFDRAVDFGILYFITKPIFMLLHYFYDFCGNFGVAILLLTVFIKLLLFPLAHKGYKSMNKLKDLQPKMQQLKERYGKDPSVFQRELLELYKREKANPMSGCLPILLQIPVFFALYKVLYVSIEMRQAPFFWWVKDLSAPDPTNIFTAFGYLPWDPPHFLMIGILPMLMALTMYAQQKLNPEPSDPVQAQVMKLMPWILLFMFAAFPSGLVIYWTWSNILSIIQQVVIKKLPEGKRGQSKVRHK
jgi:YidC/Oxa1 family membrane protein insertase